MSNAGNVTAGKPMTTGAVFRAPKGTALPTTASATLGDAWDELGYISDAGVTNSNSPSTTSIKAWGGNTVLDVQTEKPDTFKLNFIEATNLDVLKTVYGANNVSGTLETGIVINANAEEQASQSLVIDMVLKGAIKRIVIPDCKVTAVADIVYSDSSAVGYDTTLSCYPDSSGNTHYEYILKTDDPSF